MATRTRALTPAEIDTIRLSTTDSKVYFAKYDGKQLIIEEELPPPPPPPPTLAERLLGGKPETRTARRVTTPYGGKPSEKPNEKGKTPHPPKLDDTVFRARLSSIMLDNKYDRKQRGRTRGKLDMTRLYKVQTKSETVFSQKMSRKNKEYNVILLIDVSGSMSNSQRRGGIAVKRIDAAAEAATFLSKNFVGVNVNLAVVTFNHWFRVVKDFDKTITDYGEIADKVYDNFRSGQGCNHDYEAMEEAYKMFKGRKGKNILVFMSDGAPAPCELANKAYDNPDEYEASLRDWRDTGKYDRKWTVEGGFMPSTTHIPVANRAYSDAKHHFHNLVKSNEKLAATVALGIQTTSWQVPDNIEVNNLTEVKSALLKLLTKKIRRG